MKRKIFRQKRRPAEESIRNISDNKQKYLEKKEYDKNLRKLKKLEESEREIEKIEAEIAEMDMMLSSWTGNSVHETHELLS